jgi:hypothetical protein
MLCYPDYGISHPFMTGMAAKPSRKAICASNVQKIAIGIKGTVQSMHPIITIITP